MTHIGLSGGRTPASLGNVSPLAMPADHPQLYGEMLGEDGLDSLSTEAAIAEARRRWGPAGAVSVADRFTNARLLVGELQGSRFWIHGRGSSWEAAFADADARAIHGSRRKSVR